MVAWEYALLVRRYQGQGRNFHVSFVWYAPDGSRKDITAYGDTAIAHLNRAGREGWSWSPPPRTSTTSRAAPKSTATT